MISVFMFIHDSLWLLANQSVRILAGEITIELSCETEIGDITTRLRFNCLGRRCLFSEKNIIRLGDVSYPIWVDFGLFTSLVLL